MLQNVTRSPRPERFCGNFDIPVHGQKDDFGTRIEFLKPPDRFDAVQQGHGDIDHDHIRLQPLYCLQESPAISNGPYKVKLWLQQAPQSFDEHGMVISQQ
jgi:hypothetical protein